jgi:hypothetical protein
MVKDRAIEKCRVGTISIEMKQLIDNIQERWTEKYGFAPNRVDITRMIALEINKKGFKI